VGEDVNHNVSKVTGIDLGLSHFSIESNDRKTGNPRFLKRAEKNLRRKQRQLSRKSKRQSQSCESSTASG